MTQTINAAALTADDVEAQVIESSAFTFEPTQGNIKKAMAGSKSRDLYMKRITEINVVDGFNIRIKDAETEEHIEALATRIKENGFDSSKPLSGYSVVENGEHKVIILDGHCRLEAVRRLVARGEAEIEELPVVMLGSGYSAEDLTLNLINSNTGKNLRPLETAQVIGRLSKFGWDKKKIAARTGYTEVHVANMLELLSAPAKIRKMIESGQVQVATAQKAISEHGEQATEVLETALESAKAAGKDKVTPKFLPLAKFNAGIKKSAGDLYETVGQVRSDPAFDSLNDDLKSKIEDLILELEQLKSAE